MLTIKDIRRIAVEAHEGQVDADGKPHMDHVEEVASEFTGWHDHAVALLHDVLEDRPDWTADMLRERGVPSAVVEDVVLLSRRKLPNGINEPYHSAYIARIAASENDTVLRVKQRDVMVNWRRSSGDSRRERYERAAAMLGFSLTDE